jgi:hypothetical protein
VKKEVGFCFAYVHGYGYSYYNHVALGGKNVCEQKTFE